MSLKKDDDEEEKKDRERVRLQRNLDEASTFLADQLPSLWRNLYLGLIREGFSPPEALSLLKVYIAKDAPAGVHIHKD